MLCFYGLFATGGGVGIGEGGNLGDMNKSWREC